MTANPPEAAFILISSHEMEDAWRDLLLARLAMVISWFETNFPIVSARFRCIGGGAPWSRECWQHTPCLAEEAWQQPNLLWWQQRSSWWQQKLPLAAAEVTLTATGRRSVLRLRADDGGRERHFCPISYNKVKKWANCKVYSDNYVYLCYCYHSRAQLECYGMTD